MPSTRREFWQKKFEGNIGRDVNNQAMLEAAGWTVVVIWECELKAEAEGIVRRLGDELRENG